MDIPKIEDLNDSSCREVSIRLHYPDFYQYLCTTYPDYEWKVKMGLYYHNLTEPPVCVVCNNPVKFISYKDGWRRTCCLKCSQLDPETIQKKKQTCLERFGTENASQSSEVKEKSKKTCLERYGTTNGGWSEQAQEKIKRSNLKKYGVEFPMMSEDIRKKSKQTCLERYGVEHNSQIEIVKKHKNKKLRAQADKFRKINFERVIKKHDEIIGITNDNKYICRCPHPDCNKCDEKQYIITPNCYWSRQITERCTHLLPEDSSYNKNTTLELFIKSILDEYDIHYVENDRTIIKKEIDIYIPELKIGFECNGTYWHSSKFKNNRYHLNKYKDCKINGIQLIQIWSDWIINKPEIVKSMIINHLHKTPNKIRAHKCQIRQVDNNCCNEFLEANHIQGKTQFKIGYGLYYNNDLVSVMTFGHKRGCVGKNITENSDKWELVRFCTKLNTCIHGGASKLLSFFVKQHNPKIIYSYASCDISNGNLYKQLGFQTNGKITSSYWYIKRNTQQRYHRSNFTKSRIIKLGWKDTKEGWTEAEVIAGHGYDQIYDAGTTKWTLKLKQ